MLSFHSFFALSLQFILSAAEVHRQAEFFFLSFLTNKQKTTPNA